jgi:hypothetical protein
MEFGNLFMKISIEKWSKESILDIIVFSLLKQKYFIPNARKVKFEFSGNITLLFTFVSKRS